MSGKFFVFAFSINRFLNMLKKLARKPFMPVMKLLILIFHDANGLQFVPCIVINIVCRICSGPMLSQGKQGRKKDVSRKMTSLIWQTPCPETGTPTLGQKVQLPL